MFLINSVVIFSPEIWLEQKRFLVASSENWICLSYVLQNNQLFNTSFPSPSKEKTDTTQLFGFVYFNKNSPNYSPQPSSSYHSSLHLPPTVSLFLRPGSPIPLPYIHRGQDNPNRLTLGEFHEFWPGFIRFYTVHSVHSVYSVPYGTQIFPSLEEDRAHILSKNMDVWDK